jgi:hypothetical protein
MRILLLVVVLAVGGYFGSKLYIQHKVANDLDSVLVQIKPFADVTYDSVTASLNGELSVVGVTIDLPQFKDPVKLDAITLETPGFFFLLGLRGDGGYQDFEFPERLGVALEGLRAPLDADYLEKFEALALAGQGQTPPTGAEACTSSAGASLAALRSVGYTDMVMNLRFAFRRQGDDLDLEMAMHTADMYDVDITARLAGLTDPSALARGARPKLIEGRIDYVDRSLNSRMMKQCTEVHGVPHDAMVAAQLEELQTAARAYGMELDAMILAPYGEFIAGKERFTLIAKPARPVDLTQIGLYKPSDVPNLLNLMAEVH